MRRADQSRFVGVVTDRNELDRHLFRLEDDRGAADHHLADATGAEAAADDDALGVLPAFGLEVAADDERQLLGEFLDRPLYDARGLAITFGQQVIERLLGNLIAWLFTERIVARFAHRLPPVLDDLAEGALAGAVADEAFVVLQ